MNVITTNKLDFSVNFKPSEIKIANKETFEAAIKTYAKKYEGLVIDPDNVKDAKSIRAEMNSLTKSLDDKRKDIKKEFNAPLNLFEKWVKDQKEEIQKVINPIDSGIKAMEVLEAEKRLETLKTLIAEMAPNYGIEIEKFPIKPNWVNKEFFSTKGKVNKKGLEEISAAMKSIKAEKEQLETNKTLISNYAKAVGLEPESWVLQVENGITPAELMKQIDQTIKAKNERLEAERKQREYEAAISTVETHTVGAKTIDVETGEIVDEVNIVELPFGDDEDPFPVSRPTVETLTVRLSGPNHLIIQAKQYMLSIGVKVEQV